MGREEEGRMVLCFYYVAPQVWRGPITCRTVTLGVVEAEEPLTNCGGGDATKGVVLLGIEG
jgi:hypothetical protein